MYRSLTILILSFFLGLLSVNAQNNCVYQLILNDEGGDGWQGAGVNFFIDTISSSFTINGTTDTFDISVVDGDSISISYVSVGMNNSENSFQLLDSDGQVLVNESSPLSGVLFEGFVSCPDCPAIVLNSVVNVDSFDNRILIDWEPSDSLGVYQIEFARCGFLSNPDSVNVVMSSVSEVTIPNLMENTCYEYQISIVCLSGSQSIASGPHVGQTIFTNDVGISGVLAPDVNSKCEFSSSDTLFVFLKNFGAAPQTLVPFDFVLRSALNFTEGNVMMPDDGLFTGILVKDSCLAFPFETPIDIADPGEYTFTTWTALEGDGNINNDTFSFTFSHSTLLPFFEDFSDNELPFRWSSDEGNPINSGIITSELLPLNSRFTLTTERYGFISDTDSLSFDYSFTDITNSGMPASLMAGDRLVIEASDDCGETYLFLDMIDMSNFDSSFASLREHRISLAPFAGDIINFRFTALRGGSSFRVLLDNINVYECGTNSSLVVTEDDVIIAPASEQGTADGSITVSPRGGVGPYIFRWSTGFQETAQISTIDNLEEGFYSVTITDTRNPECNAVLNYNLGLVSVDQLSEIKELKIYPNPASELLNVDIQLESSLDLEVKIFNLVGQELWLNRLPANESHLLPISVSKFNSGIYFIQLSTPSGQITERFVIER